MKAPRHLLRFLTLTGLGTAWLHAVNVIDKPIRTEAEVREAGRQAVARYGDARLAAMGFLDVTKVPYLADRTGKQDATAAIQQALNDARDARLITYLPAGRYLVSATIEGVMGTVKWDHWPHEGWSDPWVAYTTFNYPCVIAGPGEGARATLVLADRAAGFQDAKKPKPVIYFWARGETGQTLEPNVSQPAINFNQKILSLDFELGTGNPGAVAISHQSAEGSTIEDVSVQATGAFAGILNAPGSGGAMHGIRVIGGRFGLYLPGSQPSPSVSDLTLRDQEEASIHYRGRGPLTVVGADIRGAPIRGGPVGTRSDGAINLIDSIVAVRGESPAIAASRSVVLDNVWFDRAEIVARIADHPPVAGNATGWTHVARYVAGGIVKTQEFLGGAPRRDGLWTDGQERTEPLLQSGPASAPPEDLLTRHRSPSQPGWFASGTANVRAAPWNAAGDGRQDDTAAIQAAIDANDRVFLPKGIYRISRPLLLRANTTLFGVTNLVSVITPLPGAPAFSDPGHPQPLVETVDDPQARTLLELVKLELPVLNPSVYALRWRAGRNSVVRNVYPIRTAWHPNAPVIGQPMVVIEGSGGGRWYTQTLLGWWSQGPDYRHLLVRGTREPLRFYHLQPQHGRSEAMIDLRDVENVDIYSMKSEGTYTVVAMQDSRRVRLFGYGGNAAMRPGWPLFRLERCADIVLAGIYPQLGGIGSVGALRVGYDPRSWLILRDGDRTIRGDQQFVLSQIGADHR